jgi:hypothetical protein
MRLLLPAFLAMLSLTGCDSPTKETKDGENKEANTKSIDAKKRGDAANEDEKSANATPTADEPNDEPNNDEANEPDAPQGDEPTKPPFAEALAKLDPKAANSLPAGVDLFLEYYAQPETKDEAELRASLDGLFALAKAALPALDTEVQASEQLVAVACEEAKIECGEVTAEAKKEYAELAKVGLRYVHAGEGTLEAVPDYTRLAKALAPALTESAKAYLDLLARQDDMDASFGEGGFEGKPADVAALIIDWEALAKADPAYEDIGELRAVTCLSSYLRLCTRPYQKPACKMDKELRSSYETFVRDHADSAQAKVVERFLAAMKKKNFRASDQQLDGIVLEALKGG